MATLPEVNAVMDDLALAYPERARKLTAQTWDQTCTVYHDVLHDVPLELLQHAARQCLATLKWFPKPAELREKAIELVMITLGIPSANEAWAEVTRRLRSSFRIRAVRADKAIVEVTGLFDITEAGYLVRRLPTADDWSVPLIQKTIDGVGGWRALQVSDNAVSDRAQFLRAYEQLSLRELRAVRLLPETRVAIEAWRANGALLPAALMSGQAVLP